MRLSEMTREERMRYYKRHALGAVLERSNRIGTGLPVRVTWGSVPFNAPALSYTDGALIMFDEKEVMALQERTLTQPSKFIMGLKGLNYHELGHILYTPRTDTDISSWVNVEGHKMPFNLLEDLRLETLMSAKFPITRHYFSASFLEWILKGGSSPRFLLAASYGRRFLDPNVRASIEATAVAEHGHGTVATIKRLIDAYIEVVYPKNTLRAKAIIKEFAAVMGSIPPTASPHLCESPGAADKGTSSTKAQEEAKEALDKQSGESDDDSDGDGSDDATSSKGKAEKNDGGDSSQESIDSDGDADGADDLDGQNEAGSGGDGASGMDAVRQEARQALHDVQSSPEVLNDLKNIQQAINKEVQRIMDEAAGNLANHSVEPLPTGARGIAGKVRNSLRRIQIDLEPAWHHAQPAGTRINMRRFMLRKPNEVDVFDRWDEGLEDEGSIEMVVLVDVSGSMMREMELVSHTLWALKAAMDECEIRTTIIAYSSGHEILYRPSEKANRSSFRLFKAHGGTDPTSAMQEASRIFVRSTQLNKVLINITDGGWNGASLAGEDTDAERMVTLLNRAGVITAQLGLDSAVAHFGDHNHTISHDLRDFGELPRWTQKLVSEILANVRSLHV